MRQLYQDAKAGEIRIVEVPEPAAAPGFVVVRNVRSVISPGTERNAVAAARDSYLKTARNRPDLVRRVLDGVRREGVLATYRKVQAKLGEPQALGYSCAGTVVAVGPRAGDHFRVGDRVACAGVGYASHAEVVSVPVQLTARIPDGVAFDAAAFATLGAIALHGVRQAAPTLGERVAVLGCGILGLITVQILRAAGVRVAAFDVDRERVERALALGAETGVAGDTEAQVQTALAWTAGVGVDAAVVTAASSTDAPMVAAGGMCRDRGRVVAVGFVPFALPREIAFAKELDLRIARSYGPGRYDAGYEEKGLDYPIGHVRWTETRNLEAFLQLLADGSVRVDSLITHRLPLERAAEGYDALVRRDGPRPLGMLLEYPPAPEVAPAAPVTPTPTAARPSARPSGDGVGVAFVGAGGFARSVLLPRFRGASGVRLRHVVTHRGLTAHDARSKFGFDEVGTDPEAALGDPSVDLVCIATRHDSHADLVARALRAGKHVFVEKPLALNEAELAEVLRAADGAQGTLTVGFNRRFAPMARAVREAVASRGPATIACRVNAGALPPGHWLNDPEVGGGRMIGEGCHFVDLASFLAGDADVVDVAAAVVGPRTAVAEDFAVQLTFADGSAAQILYTAKGDPALGKERVEVHAGGLSAVIDDWLRAETHRGGRRRRKIAPAGKGHAEEIAAVLAAVRSGGPAPVPIDVLARVTRITFRAHEILGGAPA